MNQINKGLEFITEMDLEVISDGGNYWVQTRADESVGIFPIILSPNMTSAEDIDEWIGIIRDIFESK